MVNICFFFYIQIGFWMVDGYYVLFFFGYVQIENFDGNCYMKNDNCCASLYVCGVCVCVRACVWEVGDGVHT